MKITANDLKQGHIIVYEGKLWKVSTRPEHTKPGKGGAFVQVDLKDFKHGTKKPVRFISTEYIEKANLEQKEFRYLYSEGSKLMLMDETSYEQIEVEESIAGDKRPFLIDNMLIKLEFYDEEILSIELPATVILTIEQTEPHIKGSTAAPSYKPAILSNGVKIMVPPYLETGEKVVVKTEDITYVERAK